MDAGTTSLSGHPQHFPRLVVDHVTDLAVALENGAGLVAGEGLCLCCGDSAATSFRDKPRAQAMAAEWGGVEAGQRGQVLDHVGNCLVGDRSADLPALCYRPKHRPLDDPGGLQAGDTIVLGGQLEDSNQTTITNGTSASSDSNAFNAGAADVITR